MELSFNIWNANVLGNNSSLGWCLTAYIYLNGETKTSYFKSVSLSPTDAEAFLEGDVDEQWYYADSEYYDALCEILILNLILKEAGKND